MGLKAKRILVVGGAGYIGSHMVKMLLRGGYEVTVFDDLSTGYRDAILGGTFIHASLADADMLRNVFQAGRFHGVIHFASLIQVGQSVTDPALYYRANLVNTLNLLDAMRDAEENAALIFSSTAAVYGQPETALLTESHPLHPINPYGRTKLMVEQVMADYDRAYGLRYTSLRYFNAAGADPEGELGERHEPETHLIPLILRVAAGAAPAIRVFGDDYDTPDGTAIRDFIHVEDLCTAHLLAMERIWDGGANQILNLGTGRGHSVLEVIRAAEKATDRAIPREHVSRRDGDPPRLVADAAEARRVLDWNPCYAELDSVMAHAWQWMQRS